VGQGWPTYKLGKLLRESSEYDVDDVDLPLDDSTSRDLSSNDELSPPTTEHTHGDYALVQFEGKTKKKYYVGLVLNDSPNDEDTVVMKYMHKDPTMYNTFYFPEINDIHYVFLQDIALKLNEPTLSKRLSKYTFTNDISSYNVQ